MPWPTAYKPQGPPPTLPSDGTSTSGTIGGVEHDSSTTPSTESDVKSPNSTRAASAHEEHSTEPSTVTHARTSAEETPGPAKTTKEGPSNLPASTLVASAPQPEIPLADSTQAQTPVPTDSNTAPPLESTAHPAPKQAKQSPGAGGSAGVETCIVCDSSDLAKKYRCPRCRCAYCSLQCCKVHKDQCKGVDARATESDRRADAHTRGLKRTRDEDDITAMVTHVFAHAFCPSSASQSCVRVTVDMCTGPGERVVSGIAPPAAPQQICKGAAYAKEDLSARERAADRRGEGP